ncbi:centrosomal protein of 128 kDa-like isoform X2 [Pomacea canaliculata]|uniref:centrosomal protein of 128 kDa-like isoform X2 n=1 Tax=Pomacea canaliculata TaxID=400727 RepID=UPI000D73EB2C|nr:centrosomal protein of 128 kDa-like isoform X2 [Pomacea canaliculata]
MANGGRYTSSSTESDEYYHGSRGRHHSGDDDDRMYRLTSNLKDTTRNLKTLDRMLDSYRDVGRVQRSSNDRIRGDLDRTLEDLQEEKVRGSQLDRSYGSDTEYNGSPSGGPRRRRKKSSVRFADDMNKELHGLHQNVRDLSADQLRLEENLNREIDRRDRGDLDVRRNVRDIGSNLQRQSSDPLSSRVEQRLAAIQNEIQAERRLADRQDDLTSLSSELKQAIHQVCSQPAEERLRSHYLQAESNRYKLESELDGVRRRLDQSEGSRTALQNQVEELRAQLSRAERDRHKLKSYFDEARFEEDMKEERKRRAVEETRDRNFENEIRELRGQLTRSVGAISEMESLRRALEKSERQRAQLSDHIETLSKDLENREKQAAKVITQLKTTSDNLEDTERQKAFITQQFEDVTKRLTEVTKDLEKTSHELRSTQLALQESEKKKDEFKGRAQEAVRQWKAKVKQLERDLDRTKHGSTQIMQRNEQLIKEMENQRHHGGYAQMQLDGLKRELADALAVRAAQDEQIRLKDIEVNELKSVRMDLERDLRDTRTIAEKYENELHSLRNRVAGLSEGKHKLEDELSAADAAHRLAQGQAAQLQSELKELSTVKAELAAQLSESSAKIHDFRQRVVELQHREKAAKEETELYKQKLYEERNGLSKGYDSLKQELNEAKVREAHTLQEMNRKFKREHAEYEAAIQALKIELSEEKSASKIARRSEEKLKEDVDMLEKKLKRLEEDNSNMRVKLDLVRQEFETQKLCLPRLHTVYDFSQMAEDDISRVKRLEEQLAVTHSELEKLDKMHLTLIEDIAVEIDTLLEVASHDAATGKCQPLNGIKGLNGMVSASNLLLTEIKNKLIWLRAELRGRINRERKLRMEFQQALSATDSDRQFLVSEIVRRNEELDDLAFQKQEIALKEIETMNTVEALEDQVLDLSDELQMAKIKQKMQHSTFECEKQHIIDEMEDILDAQSEKDRINQRYIKLQETLKSLQNDLQTSGLSDHKDRKSPCNGTKGSILRTSTPTTTPKKRNRVRIHEESATGANGNERIPSDVSATPPPMSLTDEEFIKRFLPSTPQNGNISLTEF